jgi:glycosyltransferase involved in cell wall biosynthesis
MQRGTPVVVSNLEIFQEVAGSAGSYFDARDAADLAVKINELGKGSNWAKASSASIAQAGNFDWDKSADQLLKAFDALESK